VTLEFVRGIATDGVHIVVTLTDRQSDVARSIDARCRTLRKTSSYNIWSNMLAVAAMSVTANGIAWSWRQEKR
jgi:hypothetical protein